jgi:hypothetical protein
VIPKPTLLYQKSDGSPILWDHQNYGAIGRLAVQILPAVLTSNVLKDCMAESGEAAIHPRKIASLACDIAQAVYCEFEHREWLVAVPVPSATEGPKSEVVV